MIHFFLALLILSFSKMFSKKNAEFTCSAINFKIMITKVITVKLST